MGTNSLLVEWAEVLYPVEERGGIDVDASLGEHLRQVGVGEAVAQIPAHRQGDHVGWEVIAGESGRAVCGAAAVASTTAVHLPSLPIKSLL